MSDDDDQIPDSASMAAACLALALAIILGALIWHGFQ